MKKIGFHKSLVGPVAAALRQVLGMLLNPHQYSITEDWDTADVVLLTGAQTLERIHTHDKVYILIVMQKSEQAPATVPANVRVIGNIGTAVVDIIKALPMEETIAEPVPTAPADALRVLVIDDTEKHCAAASSQLAAQYRLTVVTTYAQAIDEIRGRNAYDVVLTDLMLPASVVTLGTDAIRQFAGQEMPLGFVLALLAANAGTKYVAVVTDMNHHAHPMSAALDRLTDVFAIDGAKVIFTNRAGGAEGKDWKGVLDSLLQS